MGLTRDETIALMERPQLLSRAEMIGCILYTCVSLGLPLGLECSVDMLCGNKHFGKHFLS